MARFSRRPFRIRSRNTASQFLRATKTPLVVMPVKVYSELVASVSSISVPLSYDARYRPPSSTLVSCVESLT